MGSRRLFEETGAEPEKFDPQPARLAATGATLGWLATASGEPLGLIAFSDLPRPGAAEAIARLSAMGVRSAIVSGDNAAAVRTLATTLGVPEIRAEAMPAEKVDYVTGLRRKGAVVAMVGDGANDAPALAVADVGITMGSGTDVAMHAAGITLMRSDPALVADAIDISRRTWRKIWQGLGWAMVYNVVGIPLATLGLLNPMLAGAAMALSSISVIGNALTLARWRGAPS
jgi:Cu+-exporting ATPase